MDNYLGFEVIFLVLVSEWCTVSCKMASSISGNLTVISCCRLLIFENCQLHNVVDEHSIIFDGHSSFDLDSVPHKCVWLPNRWRKKYPTFLLDFCHNIFLCLNNAIWKTKQNVTEQDGEYNFWNKNLRNWQKTFFKQFFHRGYL